MLKRFLKFFKPSEEEEVPHFEGSYLDYLLDEASKGVEEEMEHCVDHDPLLLIVTYILRISMPDVWSDIIRRPLRDPTQPAPPTAPPPPPQATSEASEVSEVSEAIENDDDIEVLDEDSFIEIEEESQLGAEDTKAEDAEDPSGKPRADRKEVLQAGRVFLGMLIENDRLPPELQLGVEEILLARDLLMSYFMGQNNFEGRAQKLLKIVEQKFSEGFFSQARILLQLFQTDQKTRVRNDRNIFYEDMIQRFGIRRKRPVSKDIQDEYDEMLKRHEENGPTPEDDDEYLRWVEDHLYIKTHLFLRQQEHVKTWQRLSALSTVPNATENLLRYLPPKRWRPHYTQDVSLQDLATYHINNDTLLSYCSSQMHTCYFVLRAVGDTGLEPFLDTFFDWTSSQFDLNGTVFLPELYRRSMGDADPMRVIFQDLYDRYMRQSAEQTLKDLDAQDIKDALAKAVAQMRKYNVNDIAPGNYNLGGLIYDQLLGITYPTPEFAMKVHRLT